MNHLPDYVDALVSEILSEMRRVHWNIKQEEWDDYDPYDLELPGVTYNPYYSDDDCPCGFDALDKRWNDEHSGNHEEYARWRRDHNHDPACPIIRPNLAFEGVEIRWYKHPGRGMSSNVNWRPDQWVTWFDRFLSIIHAKNDAHMGIKR